MRPNRTSKMKYTTITKILPALVFAFGMTSCNDYLDVEPDTEVDSKQLFSSEAGFADALSGVYVEMTGDNLYGKNLTWYMLELMGGNSTCMYGNNANYMMFSFHPDASYYMESLRNSDVDPIWNKEYNAIANINSALSVIDEKQGVFQGTDYNVMKGELLGLRAFLHFDVMRLFADAYSSDSYSAQKTYIPYVTELTSNVHPLLTNDQACELMLKDLEEARELLKSDPMYTQEDPSEYVCSTVTGTSYYRKQYGIKSWHNRRFHFNYYAALATEARIYLWMGNKTKALELAKEVIDAKEGTFTWVNSTLVSNVTSSSDYVCRDRTFATEQIFALNIKTLEDKMDGYILENENSFNGSNGYIEGFNPDVFDANTRQFDIRYAYLKNVYSYYGHVFYLTTKFKKDKDTYNYSPWAANRMPLIRISEMYYIAAECEPDLTKATAYLEEVRKHRGLESYPLTISSREQLQDEIEKEYYKEMIGEGQTFYMNKRLNQAVTGSGAYQSYTTQPNLFTLPMPDDEKTYGGRE